MEFVRKISVFSYSLPVFVNSEIHVNFLFCYSGKHFIFLCNSCMPMTIAEISCGDFPIIQNTNPSATTSTGRRYEDTITYTCVTGYEITSGSDTITCQSNRRWSTSPTCSSECNVVLPH